MYETKKITSGRSIILLILANAVPVLGVVFFEWTLFSVLFFYWLESAVMGFYTALKIQKFQPNFQISNPQYKITSAAGPSKFIKIFLTGFFIIHYGIFVTTYIIFISHQFGPSDVSLLAFLTGLISLLISHGHSFKSNFLDNHEYENIFSFPNMFFGIYKRLVPMHLIIIIGGMIYYKFQAPLYVLLIFMAIKTSVDIGLHISEHRSNPLSQITKNGLPSV